MTNHVQSRLDDTIKKVVEALAYGAEDYVNFYIGDLGHRDFDGMRITFDLRDTYGASSSRDMLERAIRTRMSKDFQDRVKIIA